MAGVDDTVRDLAYHQRWHTSSIALPTCAVGEIRRTLIMGSGTASSSLHNTKKEAGGQAWNTS